MPIEKVMEEAMRSLSRIQERTQLPYAWFAATFLQKLFKSMFSGIYIDKASLEKVNMHKYGKLGGGDRSCRSILDPSICQK